MAQIPQSQLTVLLPAADAREVADTALEALDEMKVAACINNAANTGEHKCLYSHPISATLLAKLESYGYTVHQKLPVAELGIQYVIEGF